MSAITIEQFLELLRTQMPEVAELPLGVDRLAAGEAIVRLGYDPKRLRPGGTISGPTLFMLADLALYLVTLSVVGLKPLSVTTDLTIHFLRKPPPGTLLCHGRLLKAGRRLVVGEATLTSEGDSAILAHATGTYSVPEG